MSKSKKIQETGYKTGDEVFVSSPHKGDHWEKAFRGVIMASLGSSAVVSDGKNGWEIPLSRIRRPSFAFCSEDKSMPTSLDMYSSYDRTDFLCRLTDMVIQRVSPSLIVAGDPGVGKTWNVRDRFRLGNLAEGEHFYMVKGHILGLGLYKLLYQMNGKIILFDDSDSVFEDKNSQNILKAVLDSYDDRLVSWQTSAPEREGLPRCFVFTGAAIFITNKDLGSINSAVCDRSLRINFTMNNAEVLERISQVLPKMDIDMPVRNEDEEPKPVSMSVKKEVYRYLEDMQDKFTKISFRTMINAVRFRITQPDRWMEMVPLFA
jgi:hypothetical protein